MATIIGKTSEKIDELFNGFVKAVSLTSEGQLLATRGDGSVVGVGSVASSVINAVVNATGQFVLKTRDGQDLVVDGVVTLDKAWPVGSVYFSDSSVNPSTKLGGGTWVSFGAGRMPVGVDPTQTEFDASGKTGGAKTHTLTAAELPAHSHGAGTLATSSSGSHDHGVQRRGSSGSGGGVAYGAGTLEADAITSSNGAHTHTMSGSTDTGAGLSGQAHNNLPPYIAVYMWKRTA